MATTTPIAENKALLRDFFDGLDEQNTETFDELVAEDVDTDIYRSESGEQISGVEGMKALWQEYWTAFPDLEEESTDLVAEGDRVAFFRSERGTHTGEFRGVEPTGNPITFEYAGYADVEDGRIVRMHAQGSMLTLLRQMDVDIPLSS